MTDANAELWDETQRLIHRHGPEMAHLRPDECPIVGCRMLSRLRRACEPQPEPAPTGLFPGLMSRSPLEGH